jgi:hypothetical protein
VQAQVEELLPDLAYPPVVPVCSLTGYGVEELMYAVRCSSTAIITVYCELWLASTLTKLFVPSCCMPAVFCCYVVTGELFEELFESCATVIASCILHITSLLITACHSKSVQCLGHLKYPAVPIALADLYTLTYWQVVDAHDRWRRRVSTALLNQWLRKVSSIQYCMPAATVAADATL